MATMSISSPSSEIVIVSYGLSSFPESSTFPVIRTPERNKNVLYRVDDRPPFGKDDALYSGFSVQPKHRFSKRTSPSATSLHGPDPLLFSNTGSQRTEIFYYTGRNRGVRGRFPVNIFTIRAMRWSHDCFFTGSSQSEARRSGPRGATQHVRARETLEYYAACNSRTRYYRHTRVCQNHGKRRHVHRLRNGLITSFPPSKARTTAVRRRRRWWRRRRRWQQQCRAAVYTTKGTEGETIIIIIIIIVVACVQYSRSVHGGINLTPVCKTRPLFAAVGSSSFIPLF